MIQASIAFPVDMPAFFARIFERLPITLVARESKVVMYHVRASFVEHSLIDNALVSLWTGLRLECG
jgi:hypothetical protein